MRGGRMKVVVGKVCVCVYVGGVIFQQEICDAITIGKTGRTAAF